MTTAPTLGKTQRMARETLLALREGKRVGYVTSVVERGDQFRKLVRVMGATEEQMRRLDIITDTKGEPVPAAAEPWRSLA